jgi:protein-tyrosine-phosphatase
MAATVFAEELRRRGLGDLVRVSSAGTSPRVGSGADERIHAVLVSHGYPSPGAHRARCIDADDLAADLVVALGREHVGVLQKRGVADDRIRYVEVRNPCYGADFEEAFGLIDAAMPALTEWVTERLISARLKAAVGWRFWTWTPGDVLRSPFCPAAAWWSKWCDAPRCHNPEHLPPVAGCCGWYADLVAFDLVARARAYRTASRLGVVARSFDSWDYLVLGKVVLVDVVPFRPPLLMRSGNADVEYQGRCGGIVDLCLLDSDRSSETAGFALELATRYGVGVTYGVTSA